MPNKIIFGFGSLINANSLKATVPNATNIRACYIQGFTRHFNMWDETGFTETNLDLKGIPHCALNVKPSVDTRSKVNGIAFEMTKNYLQALLKREKDYDLIKTAMYDFETNEEIDTCYLFSSNQEDGAYNFDCPAQARYLKVCLDGARTIGIEFYDEFLKSTFIGEDSLDTIKF